MKSSMRFRGWLVCVVLAAGCNGVFETGQKVDPASGFLATSHQVWFTDGTVEGTVDLTPPGAVVVLGDSVRRGDLLLFGFEDELWSSDGTREGTRRVVDLRPGRSWNREREWKVVPRRFVELDGAHYFLFDDAVWRTDGTADGTRRVWDSKQLHFDRRHAAVYCLAATRERLVFVSRPPDGVTPHIYGLVPWVLDPTTGVTEWIHSGFTVQGAEGSSTRGRCLETLGEWILGSGSARDTGEVLVSGYDSTFGILPDREGRSVGRPRNIQRVGDRIYFTAQDREHGREVWITDALPEGTRRSTDLGEGERGLTLTTRFVESDGSVFFAALVGLRRPGVESGASVSAVLARTDGTPESTREIARLESTEGRGGITWLRALEDRLVFSFDDGDHGRELWTSDGTPEGTRMVADVRPGKEGCDASELTPLGRRRILFVCASGANPWVSDGTAEGTLLLRAAERESR